MRKTQSISLKLITLITTITAITAILIGVFSYVLAKNELLEAGKSELQKIADGAYTVLELLDAEVQSGDLTQEEAKDIAREILNGPLKEDNTFDYKQTNFVYKEKGYVIAYDQDLVMQVHPSKVGGEPANELNRNNRQSMVDAGREDKVSARFVEYSDEQDDGSFRDKTAYMRYFEPWDWTIGLTVFQDEFYEGLKVLKVFITCLTAFIIVLSSILFYVLTRKKLSLLKEVANKAIDISNGRIAESHLPESKDEIGILAKSFNTMSQELRNLVTNVQSSSGHLLDSATDLSAVSEQTSASSEEIGHAMNEISKGTQEQVSSLEDIHYRFDTLTNSINQMKEQTDIVDQITQETEMLSNEGIEIVSKLQDSNQQSVNRAKIISEDIQRLNQKVQDITAVMDTIEHVAEETNLLALNASIEAARAGEFGKGFAVVADEIRKLSEQSRKATHQVQDVVSKIVEETENTVQAVQTNQKISEELNHDVEQTEVKFQNMQRAVNEIVTAIVVVNSGIKGITSEANMIKENVEGISSVSEETAASIEEITSSLDEQINAIGNVARSAETLTSLNHELSSSLKKYSLE